MTEVRGSDLKSRMAAFTRMAPASSPPIPETAKTEQSTTEATHPVGQTTVEAGTRAERIGTEEVAPPRHARITCEVPADLLDKVRNAVVALSPEGLTLAGFVAQAMERELDRLEADHNGGDPFPERSRRELQRGRRIR